MASRIETFPARWLDWKPPSDCHDFGIGEILAATLPAVFATETGAATLGATVLGSALPGAAFGAATSGLTGGDPLLGALTGGFTGGVTGGAGALAPALGVSPTLAETVGGAGAGFLGSEVTGQDPLMGALTGGASGLASGLFSAGGAAAPGVEGGGPIGGSGGGAPVASAAPSSAAPLSGELSAAASIPTGTADFQVDAGSSGVAPITTGNALSSIAGPTSPTNLTGGLGGATGNTASGGGASMSDLLPGYGGSGGGSDDFGGGASGNFLSDALGTTGGTGIGSRIVNYLGDHPMLGLGGALLGGSLLMGSGSVPGSEPLKQDSALLSTLGNQEVKSLQTGQVPAGAQSLLDQQKAAVNARTRSTFANLGLSGSTMEAQALAQNEQAVEANKWKIISDLVSQGTTTLQGAATIDNNLMLQEIARDKESRDAISRFAAALAGGSMLTK